MREQSRNDEDLGVRYLQMALQHGRAARVLLDGNQIEAPFWHCVGHALELSLKALLERQGYDEMDLMHLVNHHLHRAEQYYRAGSPDSKLISNEASQLVRELSCYHARLDFRYPCLFPVVSLPDPAGAERVLDVHLTTLADHFGGLTRDRS